MNGELLITLKDSESDQYEVNSRSRRLVRHVTFSVDIIREYEFLENGAEQTRLFTDPWRVTQNGNTDICVINGTSDTSSELLIISVSGSFKSVYHGQDNKETFKATDVVCDIQFNIIVSQLNNSELKNSAIHLLSPDRKSLRYLLKIKHPISISLNQSTLCIDPKDNEEEGSEEERKMGKKQPQDIHQELPKF
ncbi:uncharacterized protein LOC144624627 [Crassostrea virginica]